jgi:hypothetical protein
MDDYVAAVCADIAASAARAGSTPPQLHTVYFGGGTPSLLPAPQLGRILDALRRTFGVAPGAEVSMELDPGAATLFAKEPSCGWPGADRGGAGSFDEASLAAYLALGVTRVNLGVQSFDAAMLKGAANASLAPRPEARGTSLGDRREDPAARSRDGAHAAAQARGRRRRRDGALRRGAARGHGTATRARLHGAGRVRRWRVQRVVPPRRGLSAS